jgi:hypothetical protein
VTRKRAFAKHNVTRRPMAKRVTVWLAMRQLIRFDMPTLVMTAVDPARSPAERSVKDFVYALVANGYLRVERVSNGLRGGAFMYQLLRDTGPLPPLTKRNGDVYDQNEKKLYVKEAASDQAAG